LLFYDTNIAAHYRHSEQYQRRNFSPPQAWS
jgi:hypothetical protein